MYVLMYICILIKRYICTYIHKLYTGIQNRRQICMGIYLCMYGHKYTYYTQPYVVMHECIHVHSMFGYVYMLYGCKPLGMYIGR